MLLISLLAVSGCRTAEIQDRPPINAPHGLTAAQVDRAIVTEIIREPEPIPGSMSAVDAEILRLVRQSHEWVLESREPGLIIASVPHGITTFSLLLSTPFVGCHTDRGGKNLRRGSGRVHKNALAWNGALE